MMSRLNLSEIGPGWQAVMKGTYWGKKLTDADKEAPDVTEETLECLGPIKPKDNPDFEPDRFMFRLPENVHGGTLLVFSADDIKTWLPPEGD